MKPSLKTHKLRNAAACTVSLLALGGAAYGQNLLVSLNTSARSAPMAEPAGTRVSSGSESPSVTSRSGAGEEGPSTTAHHGGAANEEPATSATRHGGAGHREARANTRENGAWVGSKGGMPEAAPAARPVVFNAEFGYDSKYVWRGIDILRFDSFNHFVGSGMKSPDDGIYFAGISAAWNGWSVGVKSITSLSDRFNPVFSRRNDREQYQEYIFSLNYSYAVLPDGWLNVTPGFDYYYYPQDNFWGVSTQGLAYLKFVTPHYKWAQPFLDVFTNVATSGATDDARAAGRKVDKLVAGRGFEVGLAGGDQVYSAGNVRVGLSYSLSTTYKDHYFFEPDRWTHVTASLGLPVSICESWTVTPSVNYVWALQTTRFPASTFESTANTWDNPGFWWGLKANYMF